MASTLRVETNLGAIHCDCPQYQIVVNAEWVYVPNGKKTGANFLNFLSFLAMPVKEWLVESQLGHSFVDESLFESYYFLRHAINHTVAATVASFPVWCQKLTITGSPFRGLVKNDNSVNLLVCPLKHLKHLPLLSHSAQEVQSRVLL